MLKLAILVTVAMMASATIVVHIENDPYVLSVKKGLETCSYSSPDWVASLFHPQLLIDSIFADGKEGNQHPTFQRSIKITFRRSLKMKKSSKIISFEQHYSAPTTDIGLSSTLDSGYASVSGWLDVNYYSPDSVSIDDWNTGSTIVIYRNPSMFYNLYVFSSTSFLSTAGGLLIEGCPYNAVYPWQAYGPNPNIGRRKRQADPECDAVAKAYAETFPNQKAFSYEKVLAVCEGDSKFVENTPKTMLEILRVLSKSYDSHQSKFPEVQKQ